MCDAFEIHPRTVFTRRAVLEKIGWAGVLALTAGCKTTGVEDAIANATPPRPAFVAERRAALVYLRPSEERGHVTRSWLDTRHSFSFSSYRDPRFDSFRALRVLNEDWIGGASGFPMHGHRDMEIVTWVLDGELEHRDSTGGGGVIAPSQPQRMSAGTGIRHSEFNPAAAERTHLLQIWLHPDRRGHEPGYEESAYDAEELANAFAPIATPTGAGRSVKINQDARILAGRFSTGTEEIAEIEAGRYAFTQIARGSATINGERLDAGDAAAWTGGGELQIRSDQDCEVLLFDLA